MRTTRGSSAPSQKILAVAASRDGSSGKPQAPARGPAGRGPAHAEHVTGAAAVGPGHLLAIAGVAAKQLPGKRRPVETHEVAIIAGAAPVRPGAAIQGHERLPS